MFVSIQIVQKGKVESRLSWTNLLLTRFPSEMCLMFQGNRDVDTAAAMRVSSKEKINFS